MRRVGVLREAELIVTQDRNASYGEPEDSFRLIAKLWADYLGTEILTEDVPAMMVLLKIARLRASNKQDNWIDIAGYAACGGEVAQNDTGGKTT